MTRARFLNDLYRLLAGNGMSGEQAEQHLTYYAEMLADRMEEGMTEEQAVERMEDVNTIARRILEEEGMAYRPLSEIPVAPPAYPDASKLGGGGGKRGYQVPKRWNGRRVAQIALWTLAIVIALGAVSRWLWMRNVRRHNMQTAPADYATSEPVVEAPYAYEWEESFVWDEDYVWDMPYMEGYEHTGNSVVIDAGTVNSIDIQWAAGTVYVQSTIQDQIQVMEYSSAPITSERTMFHAETVDGKLTIRFRENGASLGNVKGDKWLTVLVPDSLLEELEIETTSAGVQLSGLELDEISVETTSGEVRMQGCYLRKADIETVSGDVSLNELYADELDVSTTSGDVDGYVYGDAVEVETISGDVWLSADGDVSSVQMASTSGDVRLNTSDESIGAISAHTTSGCVTLSLPYDLGFTLDYKTVSGELINSSFDCVMQNGKTVHNGGGCVIVVETVSGNLDIY